MGNFDEHNWGIPASGVHWVALRLNQDITGDRGITPEPADTLRALWRAAYWRSIESEEWVFWSADLVDQMLSTPALENHLKDFQASTGLSFEEWFYRNLGERASRVVRGAHATFDTEGVDEDLERAWREDSPTAPVTEIRNDAVEALYRRRRKDPPMVRDPFDLRGLASRPFVATPDGGRLSLWLGAITRLMLPSSLAQTLADETGAKYDDIAAPVGKAAEDLLRADIAALPAGTGERRLDESDFPDAASKCDFVLETIDTVIGIEFTLISPTRGVSQGGEAAQAELTAKLAEKVEQTIAACLHLDPKHEKRWLSLLVLHTPSVVEPLLNDKVRELDWLPATACTEKGRRDVLLCARIPRPAASRVQQRARTSHGTSWIGETEGSEARRSTSGSTTADALRSYNRAHVTDHLERAGTVLARS